MSFFIQPVLHSFDIGPSAYLGSSLPSCVRVEGSDTKGPVRSRASNCKTYISHLKARYAAATDRAAAKG